ncbi:MAG TPA: DUF5362 family protein [Puia sp.]|nr:DUF5362 family protein [Puia sp.]
MDTPNSLDNIFKISFDDNGRDQLQTITLWAKICAICAFIGYAITLFVAFFGRTRYSEMEGAAAALGKGATIAFALLTAIIGTAINYFLYKFATDAKKGLSNIDQIKLNEGLSSLKTYFKILGIILLIVLIFAALAIVFGIIGSVGRQ